MEVNKLSKLIESVDEVMGEDMRKDTLKAAIVEHLLNKQDSSALIDFLKKATNGQESILTKNWRPATVIIAAAILVNNYLIYPYLRLFFDAAPYIILDNDMQNALVGFLIAYALGRSGEKMVTTIKTGSSTTPPLENK